MQKNESSVDRTAIERRLVHEYRELGYSARVIEIEAGRQVEIVFNGSRGLALDEDLETMLMTKKGKK